MLKEAPMSRTLIIVVLTASLLLGFVGGALSIRLLTHTKLTVRYIEVVDTEGNARIKLYAKPLSEEDIRIAGGGNAVIEMRRADQSMFALLDTNSGNSGMLSFYSRGGDGKALCIDHNIISWMDNNRSRMYVGHMWTENMRERFSLDPYSLIVFNDDMTAKWQIPSVE
ncbi:hypothetical protein ES708_30181 [subsurface metagenome]